MARILRGDIVWADLNPVRGHEQGGHRPVVVISEDVFNAKSAKLPKRSWVKISQVRTLSVQRVGKRISRLSSKEMGQLIEGLNEIVGG